MAAQDGTLVMKQVPRAEGSDPLLFTACARIAPTAAELEYSFSKY